MHADSVDDIKTINPCSTKDNWLTAWNTCTTEEQLQQISSGDPVYSTERKQSICRIQAHSQATFHEQKSTITPGHSLSRYGINVLTKHAMKVCSSADPSEDCGSIFCATPYNNTPLCSNAGYTV